MSVSGLFKGRKRSSISFSVFLNDLFFIVWTTERIAVFGFVRICSVVFNAFIGAFLKIILCNSSSVGSSTRGIFAGGRTGSAAYTNVIQYVNFATTGNASYFGDLSGNRQYLAGVSSDTRGVFGGGNNSNGSDTAFIMRTGSADLEVFKPTVHNFDVTIKPSAQLVLSYVSQSLNFANDTDAATGGVPLGGVYRNGNFYTGLQYTSLNSNPWLNFTGAFGSVGKYFRTTTAEPETEATIPNLR